MLLDGRWRRSIKLSRSTETSVSCTTHQFCVALANGQAREYFAGRWHPAQAVPRQRSVPGQLYGTRNLRVRRQRRTRRRARSRRVLQALRVGSAQTLFRTLSCAGHGCIVADQSEDATRLQLTARRTRHHR
jgi:hypothetical protein